MKALLLVFAVAMLFQVDGNLVRIVPDSSDKSGNEIFHPLPGSMLFKSYPKKNKAVLVKRSAHSIITNVTTIPSTHFEENCSSTFTCSNCHTAQVCHPRNGKLVPLLEIKCSKNAPFCNFNSGTCSVTPDYSRCGAPNNFVCMDNGYFPDPLNCSVYHVCNNYTAQEFFCLEGNVYNPDEMKCQLPSTSTCNTVNCSQLPNTDTGVKQIIGDTHYFAYCSNNQPVLVDRCPHNYKLNTTSQNCEPICQRDGLMQDLANCTNYYKCNTYYLNETMPFIVRQNLPCPHEEAFDESQFQCVPKTSTDCKT